MHGRLRIPQSIHFRKRESPGSRCGLLCWRPDLRKRRRIWRGKNAFSGGSASGLAQLPAKILAIWLELSGRTQGPTIRYNSRRPRRVPRKHLGPRRRGGYAQTRDFHQQLRRIQHAPKVREHGASHPGIPPARSIRPDTDQTRITVYYTELNVGGISFAILADRTFKSAPGDVLDEPVAGSRRLDHVTDPNFDTRLLDKPGLKLLGIDK